MTNTINILSIIVLVVFGVYIGFVIYSAVILVRKVRCADSIESRDKSRKLFIACMGEEAYASFLYQGFLTIKGQSGNCYDITGTVIYDNNKRRKFCFAPSEVLPKTDVALAQIIMLKCNEREALSVAQWWTW